MNVKVKFLLTLATTFILATASAQDVSFTFNYIQEELRDTESDPSMMEEHHLGFEIAKKFQLLKESYTYEEPPTATNPTPRTVVEKPAIYYSVKKIDKHYKRAIRKGEITEDEARKQLNNILNIALNVRFQETEKFEEMLWNLKSDPLAAADFYAKNVNLEL